MFSKMQQFQIGIAIFCIPWITYAICMGHNYEAGVPVPEVIPPTVTLLNHGGQLEAGKTVTLSARAVVDTQRGGEAQFYWCAKRGHFEVDATTQNFEKIRYVAPAEEGVEEIQIVVQVSDGLGYVGGDSAFFKVGKPLLAQLADFKASFSDTGVLLTWQTLAESDVAGFVVWRGQPKGKECTRNSEDYGEVVQLGFENSQGSSHSKAIYIREDYSAQRGTRYCYVLEEIDTRGNRLVHWEVIQSVND